MAFPSNSASIARKLEDNKENYLPECLKILDLRTLYTPKTLSRRKPVVRIHITPNVMRFWS